MKSHHRRNQPTWEKGANLRKFLTHSAIDANFLAIQKRTALILHQSAILFILRAECYLQATECLHGIQLHGKGEKPFFVREVLGAELLVELDRAHVMLEDANVALLAAFFKPSLE